MPSPLDFQQVILVHREDDQSTSKVHDLRIAGRLHSHASRGGSNELQFVRGSFEGHRSGLPFLRGGNLESSTAKTKCG
jgi:hypothetical protein